MATLTLDFLRNYRLGTYRESEPVAYQYDQGHVLNILIPGVVTSAEVQYWTRGMKEAAAYEVGSITQQSDGSYAIECSVPNEFFGTWGDLRVYLVVTDDSKYVVTYEGRIKVLQREKPEDYVDDDPDNEALRILIEAREAAQTATAAADRAEEVEESIPADYTELTDEVSELNERLDNLDPGLSDDAKTALLNCFAHVAWVDDHGQDYYDALEEALYADQYPMITVVYAPGTHVVYTDDTLDSLKPYLTVTYYETSESAGSTISSNDYSLLGTLSEGSNTISVLYQNLHASVSVNNVVDFYNIYEWSMSNGLLISHVGTVHTNADKGMIIGEGANDRRTVGTIHGVLPYWGTITDDWLDIYPVPVPMNAKKATLTITPSKSLISRGFRAFVGTKYGSTVGWVTYLQGPLVIDLPERQEQYYMQLVTQYESGSSTYPEEIEEFTISFSDEA